MKEYFKPFFNPWHYSLCDYKEFCFWKWTIENIFYENPRHLFRWIKWFFQRGSRGWADCDWWNMHSYLCEIIIPMLKELKENKHGVPCGLDDDFDEALKKWDKNITDMIEAFEAAERVISDDYGNEDMNKALDGINLKSKDGLEQALRTRVDRKVVRKWIKMSKDDQKIFNTKVKVFTKWFFSLWD